MGLRLGLRERRARLRVPFFSEFLQIDIFSLSASEVTSVEAELEPILREKRTRKKQAMVNPLRHGAAGPRSDGRAGPRHRDEASRMRPK